MQVERKVADIEIWYSWFEDLTIAKADNYDRVVKICSCVRKFASAAKAWGLVELG